MDYDAWELRKSFASLDVYNLQLPNGLRMSRLIRQVSRRLRCVAQTDAEVLLRRLLNEETDFASIGRPYPQDYKYVLKKLQRQFGRKGLVVGGLTLTFAEYVRPIFPYDPYDIVRAHFTVQRAQA